MTLLAAVAALASTAALIATPTASAPIALTRRPVIRTGCVFMNKQDHEGYNSLRRWPSSAKVSLTSPARRYFGLEADEADWDELKGLKVDVDWEALIDSRPMADQRGEMIKLDLNEKGALFWAVLNEESVRFDRG